MVTCELTLMSDAIEIDLDVHLVQTPRSRRDCGEEEGVKRTRLLLLTLPESFRKFQFVVLAYDVFSSAIQKLQKSKSSSILRLFQ